MARVEQGIHELHLRHPWGQRNPICLMSSEPRIGIEYASGIDRILDRTPLRGPYFETDSRRVHSFLQGELPESWIRSLARYQDRRRDMIALRNHYAGEGNSSHRISDANRIRSTLHYKSERAISFSKFLDAMQKTFTIFEEEGEPHTERAKVDELLTKVHNPSLTAAIAQLRLSIEYLRHCFYSRGQPT
jgi:hypothetical protein